MHETPLFQSATDAALAIRRKELSSRELTETLLTRIEAVNPTLNAVVELRREAALQEAVAADETIARGGEAGPLHGVPMTIKDSFNVAGLHTTWGNPASKDFMADSDATVVRRLRHSGAIIVGKTNVAFMLGDFGQTANELYLRRHQQSVGHHAHAGRLLRRNGSGTVCRDDVPRIRI
jgi:amidase